MAGDRRHPVNRLGYAANDACDLAAACACGLSCHHAFNDANKDTGWGCCVLFLEVNGISPAVPAAEFVERMPGLVQGRLDEAGFAAWLRAHRRR